MFSDLVMKLQQQQQKEAALEMSMEIAIYMDKLLVESQDMIRRQTEALEKTARSMQEIERVLKDNSRPDVPDRPTMY